MNIRGLVIENELIENLYNKSKLTIDLLKSLNIFVNDILVYLFLKRKISKK